MTTILTILAVGIIVFAIVLAGISVRQILDDDPALHAAADYYGLHPNDLQWRRGAWQPRPGFPQHCLHCGAHARPVLNGMFVRCPRCNALFDRGAHHLRYWRQAHNDGERRH